MIPGDDIRAAAVERARRALADLARLDLRGLSRISLSLADVDARGSDRETAVRAAERAGLGELLVEVRQAARDYVTSTFDRGGFLAIGVDIAEARSRASADDRVAVMVAAEDDVIAAVAAPFIAEQVRVTLTTPMDRLHLVRGGVIASTADSSAALEARRAALRRASMIAAFAALVIGSLVLIAIGSGIGAFGLAAAIGIGLVAVVVRGRVLP